jgi:hypothetical protein
MRLFSGLPCSENLQAPAGCGRRLVEQLELPRGLAAYLEAVRLIVHLRSKFKHQQLAGSTA